MNYRFSGHAFKRMAERNVSPEAIKAVIENGKVIKEYNDDKPLPSRLILGYDNARPLHVVTAYNAEIETEFIITVYEPNREQWTDDFTTRRK